MYIYGRCRNTLIIKYYIKPLSSSLSNNINGGSNFSL